MARCSTEIAILRFQYRKRYGTCTGSLAFESQAVECWVSRQLSSVFRVCRKGRGLYCTLLFFFCLFVWCEQERLFGTIYCTTGNHLLQMSPKRNDSIPPWFYCTTESSDRRALPLEIQYCNNHYYFSVLRSSIAMPLDTWRGRMTLSLFRSFQWTFFLRQFPKTNIACFGQFTIVWYHLVSMNHEIQYSWCCRSFSR